MTMVALYQVVQTALLAMFAIAISDIRRKDNMSATFQLGWLALLKAVYLVPLAIYGYTLLALQALTWLDAVAITLTAIGTFLAVRAKIDLGAQHAWVGYHRDGTQVVTHGIYSYIRHPIYSGILFFIAGGLSIALPRVSTLAVALGGLSLVYIIGFLSLAARRESHRLTVVHGDEYGDYKKQVHPFLPVKKYRKAA